MFFQQIGWRPLAVGLAVWVFSGFLSPPTAQAEKMASLSGYVYLDSNNNNALNVGTDYAIRFAKISLTRSDDPDSLVQVMTDATGFYKFDDIVASAGTMFTLTRCPYTAVDGFNSLGKLYDENAVLANANTFGTAHNGANDPLKGSFTSILLEPGFVGMNYNFGLKTYPLELLSKRIYMDLGTPDVVPVPEPNTLLLALVGGGLVGGVALRRRRRRA